MVSTIPYREMSTVQRVSLDINCKDIQTEDANLVHCTEVSLIQRCPLGQVQLYTIWKL